MDFDYDQFQTTDGRTVTFVPKEKLWMVTRGNFTRKLFSLNAYLHYMTKQKARTGMRAR